VAKLLTKDVATSRRRPRRLPRYREA